MGQARGQNTARKKSAAKKSFRKKLNGFLKSRNEDLREKLDRSLIEGTALCNTIHGISDSPQAPTIISHSQNVDDSGLTNITTMLHGL